jgi:hypothetical protein
MKVIKAGHHWIVALSWHFVPSIVIHRRRDERGVSDYRWSGTEWIKTRTRAKRFEIEDDAQKYVADNSQIMLDAMARL